MDAARVVRDAVPPAALDAYRQRFGHAFVICLDDCGPAEAVVLALTAIRTRLGHRPDRERGVAADELRRLARGRLAGIADGG